MAEDYGITVSSASYDGILAGDGKARTKPVTIKSGEGELAAGTVLGKITKEVGAVVPGGGNVGNGTVSSIVMGALAVIGNYVLTCIRALTENRTAPTTGTPGGGNTGDGTMTGVTAGDGAVAGTYTMACIDAPGGAVSTPTTGTADGGNTGNGTMTGVTAGAEAQAGTYTMECIDTTVSGGEVFKVIDPDNNRLDDATVGAAYTSAQINFTLNDGAVDFAVGDKFTVAATQADGNDGKFKVVNPNGHRLDDATVGVAYTSDEINFTINDGATDFAIDDEFTVPVSNGGVFSVVGPDGSMMPFAQVGVPYSNDQINFTITDGATDWAEGDTLTIPVEAPAEELWVKSLAASVDGSQEIDSILTADVDATSSAVLKTAYHTGDFKENKLTFGTGHSADSLREAAAAKGMYFYDETQLPVYS